jgi:hypothetical protein
MNEYLFTVLDNNQENGTAQYAIKGKNFQSAITRLLNVVSTLTEDDIVQINQDAIIAEIDGATLKKESIKQTN